MRLLTINAQLAIREQRPDLGYLLTRMGLRPGMSSNLFDPLISLDPGFVLYKKDNVINTLRFVTDSAPDMLWVCMSALLYAPLTVDTLSWVWNYYAKALDKDSATVLLRNMISPYLLFNRNLET